MCIDMQICDFYIDFKKKVGLTRAQAPEYITAGATTKMDMRNGAINRYNDTQLQPPRLRKKSPEAKMAASRLSTFGAGGLTRLSPRKRAAEEREERLALLGVLSLARAWMFDSGYSFTSSGRRPVRPSSLSSDFFSSSRLKSRIRSLVPQIENQKVDTSAITPATRMLVT